MRRSVALPSAIFLALRRGVVVADHELLALPVEHLARRRQAHAALAAHKQRIAELLLEQLDLLADGRLRDALLLGSLGEIEVFPRRIKNTGRRWMPMMFAPLSGKCTLAHEI